MTSVRNLIAAALVAVFSGAAYAATLTSPPLTPGNGNELRCEITNLSSQARTVTIEVIGFCTSACPPGANAGDGNILATVSPLLGPLNTGFAVVADLSTPSITPHFCRYTVQGGKKTWRASACALSGGTAIACAPAN
jgi:hypothetical protein